MTGLCDLILVHYSAIPLEEIKSFDQRELLDPYGKPRGLWVAVELEQADWNGWRDWCESEEAALDKFEQATRVHLKGDAKIKLISDDDGIGAFDEQFSRPIADYRGHGSRGIDWKSVSQSYAGIIISPYIWGQHRWFKPSWYYAWHCASGCIWDARAIGSAEPLSSFKKPVCRRREMA